MTVRVGQGFDVHPFGDDPARPLVLGGVIFEGAMGLAGHSDADAVAHANAEVIDRLIAGGAIIIGKLATYEWGTVGPDKGGLFPPARNPWSLAHITGGSSSGSADRRCGRTQSRLRRLPPGTKPLSSEALASDR